MPEVTQSEHHKYQSSFYDDTDKYAVKHRPSEHTLRVDTDSNLQPSVIPWSLNSSENIYSHGRVHWTSVTVDENMWLVFGAQTAINYLKQTLHLQLYKKVSVGYELTADVIVQNTHTSITETNWTFHISLQNHINMIHEPHKFKQLV